MERFRPVLDSQYYYRQLPEKERLLYRKMLLAVLRRDEKVRMFPPCSQESIWAAFTAMLWDNPDLPYVVPKWVSRGFKLLNLMHEVRFSYTCWCRQSCDIAQRIGEWVTAASASVPLSASPADKARFLFDWLCDRAAYDGNIDYYENSQNAAGAFLDGITACAGFAHAYQMLCRAASIPCIVAVGTCTGDDGRAENHAWNIVEIDGRYYHVDAASSARKLHEQSPAVHMSCLFDDETAKAAGYSLADTWAYPTCDDGSLAPWMTSGGRLCDADLGAIEKDCAMLAASGTGRSLAFAFDTEEEAERCWARLARPELPQLIHEATGWDGVMWTTAFPAFRAVAVAFA